MASWPHTPRGPGRDAATEPRLPATRRDGYGIGVLDRILHSATLGNLSATRLSLVTLPACASPRTVVQECAAQHRLPRAVRHTGCVVGRSGAAQASSSDT